MAIVYLGVVRLDMNGEACASEGSEDVKAFGQFALDMFISELVLGGIFMSMMSISIRYRADN